MIDCRITSLALLIATGLGAGCGIDGEESQDIDALCPDCDRPLPREPREPPEEAPWTHIAGEGPVSYPFGPAPEQQWRVVQQVDTGFIHMGASPGYFAFDNLENSQPISWYGTTYWSCTNPDQFMTFSIGSETNPVRLGAWGYRWLSQGCYYGAYVWAEMYYR